MNYFLKVLLLVFLCNVYKCNNIVCSLTDIHIINIFSSLEKNKSLECLKIDHNLITDIGAIKISNKLSKLYCLKRLFLMSISNIF